MQTSFEKLLHRSGQQLVAYERELFAVGRPRRHVNGSLSAKQFCKNRDLAIRKRHEAKRYVLVFRMTAHISSVGKKNDPFPVWRWMREPIIEFVRSDLFLRAAIRFHSPDLHLAGALRIKVD